MNTFSHFAKLLSFTISMVFLATPVCFSQKASQLFKTGDKAFFDEDYNTAIDAYSKGLAQKPNNLKAQFRMGFSYLQLRQTKKALSVLRSVNQKTKEFNPEMQLLLGQGYHLDYKFDSAVVYYHEFKRFIKDDDYETMDAVNKYLRECSVGKELLANPVNVKLENLGEAINSSGSDYVPVITPDEKTLVFTSRRSGNIGSKKDENGEPFEDIYFSVKEKNKWTAAQNIGAPINTERHDAVVGISANGKTLFLYKDQNGGDIYMSEKIGSSWSVPTSMGQTINSKHYEPSLSISDEGDYAFFSSNRPEGLGGLDLYVTLKQPDGTWGEALNLGPIINTEFDEDAPFIHSATNTLYFSSRGPKSMGGYDIFKAEMKDLAWTQPQNLGIPINTADNDIHYTVPANINHAYYSTNRTGGAGNKDIYRVVYLDPLDQKAAVAENNATKEEVKSISKLTLTGIITDNETAEPLAATITFSDSENNFLASAQSDDITGTYTAEVEGGQMLAISVKSPGYFNFTDQIFLPSLKSGQIVQHFSLKEVKAGVNVVLENIYFELNKAVIEPQAYPQLEELYKWLSENPKIKIEIGGHTDNTGTAAENKILSEERAKAVHKYLVDKGISANRIQAKGYGRERPLADNETEEGRSRNRRTEFTILPN